MRLPNDIEPDDVHQWLQGTWFRVNGVPHSWHGLEDDVLYARNMGRHIERVELHEVDTHWPLCGAVNVGSYGALYVQRVVRRQWRRSYTPRDCMVKLVNEWRLTRNESPLIGMGPSTDEVVRALFDPTYPRDFEAAVALLATRPTVALNHRIILGDGVGGRVLVYYNARKAGYIEREGGLWRAEIDDPVVRARLEKMIYAV